MTMRASFVALLAIVLSLALPMPAQADYPERPIRFVMGFPAGGLYDTVGRLLADKMSPNLGKPVIVDNRPGASGKVAEEHAAASEPDGYTLFVGDVLRAVLMPGASDIDMLKSFAVVGEFGSTPYVMTISATLGVKDFPSLVSKLKAERGKYSFGSIGIGTGSTVISAMLMRQLGLDLVEVPYRGGGEAFRDLATGNIVWLVAPPVSGLSLIESGQILPVFVAAPDRIKQLPNVPTLKEVGFPQIPDARTSMFAMLPAATPRPIVEKVNTALKQAQRDPDLRERLDKLVVAMPTSEMTIDEAHAVAQRQLESWKSIARQSRGQ